MAGIGFELNKLFKDSETTLGDLKALTYSTLISVGPWIITTIILNLILLISKISYCSISVGENFQLNFLRCIKNIPPVSGENFYIQDERQLFVTVLLYAFIFSQIIASPWQYFVARYISDAIYLNQSFKLQGALNGVMKVTTLISFIVASIFLKFSTLTPGIKLMGVSLFVLLVASWTLMNFISVLKSLDFVVKAYIGGGVLSVVLAFIFTLFPLPFKEHQIASNLLLAYTLGFFCTTIFLAKYLNGIFKSVKSQNSYSFYQEFEFLGYFRGFGSLALINLFYTLGVWGSLFTKWFYTSNDLLGSVFEVNGIYEVALFYAFVSTIPSMVYFVVFLETHFFPSYKKYYAQISIKGTLEEVEAKRKAMVSILKEELSYCMEMQFFITISIVLFSSSIANLFHVDSQTINLFKILTFASFCVVFVSTFITIFLYFDSRVEALVLATSFFVLSYTLSPFFQSLGEEYDGFGFFLASFISLIIGHWLLNNIIKDLNNRTFYRQNFEQKVGNKFTNKLIYLFEKKLHIYLSLLVITTMTLTGCTSYDNKGFNNKTNRNWHTMSNYDLEGYDYDGFNSLGLNKYGFEKNGYNIYSKTNYDYLGFDIAGVHKETKSHLTPRGFNRDLFNEKTNSLYDIKGFDVSGIHKDTGTKFNSVGWDLYGLNEKTNTYYDEEGYNIEGYSEEGYNRQGLDRDGYNRRGFNRDGYNRFTESYYDFQGFDSSGYNHNTSSLYNELGFDFDGIHKDTKGRYDKRGFDNEGNHKNTGTLYNQAGFNAYGVHRETEDIYSPSGYDVDGKKRPKESYWGVGGIHEKTGTIYDEEGYNFDGVDRDGFNRDGVYIYE